MAGAKMTNAPRGTKIVTEHGPPLHGEPKTLGSNPAAPDSMRGGPRDLSRTLGGATIPGGAKD
jgi:hypothetical protein